MVYSQKYHMTTVSREGVCNVSELGSVSKLVPTRHSLPFLSHPFPANFLPSSVLGTKRDIRLGCHIYTREYDSQHKKAST